jgi:hypothetical protein
MQKIEIDALVSERTRESRTLDYKESLEDLRTEKAKVDLLCDVASFANTIGGSILVGVTEERDSKNEQTGVPEVALGLANFNHDFELKRIENILATGIEPRVGITPEIIDGFHDGPVLALHIRPSWVGPHMVRNGRFYGRDNTGRKLMDYHMIRNSFISFLSLNEAVRSFQRERVGAIFEGKAPVHINAKSLLVIHALPISAFVPAATRNIPLDDLQGQAYRFGFGTYIPRGRPNLDGLLLVQPFNSGGCYQYVQAFRHGVFEKVHADIAGVDRGVAVVSGKYVAEIIETTVRGFLEAQRELGLDAPVVLMVTIKGVLGHRIAEGGGGHLLRLRDQACFDRDELAFPEFLCDDLQGPYDSLINDLLNIFWQAGGLSEGAPQAQA